MEAAAAGLLISKTDLKGLPSYRNPFEFDMLLQEPVHAIMEKGIRISQSEKKKLQKAEIDAWDEAQGNLNKILGKSINANGNKVLGRILYEDLKLPARKKKKKITVDEGALRATMAECALQVESLKSFDAKRRWLEGYMICYLVLKIRGQRKKISSYLGLSINKGKLAGPIPFEDPDGRIRCSISVGGTETHRFSHSKTPWDTGLNLATVPMPIRSMFIADKGCELAEIDLNRGESWIYAHLSGDPELLRIHREGLDFHAETASTVSTAFGKPLTVDWIIENKKKDAYKIRFIAKKINHATSYRMGPFLGAESVNEEAEETGVTCTMSVFKTAQDLWHARYFMVKSGWWNEIEQILGESRTLVTPYGRIHKFHGSWGDSLFKSATAYVPQSTSVDYLNRGLLRVYHLYQKTGLLNILAQTHDSILIQYKESDRNEVIPLVSAAIHSTLTIKGSTFSIPTEAGYGQNWKDLEEFKLPKVA